MAAENAFISEGKVILNVSHGDFLANWRATFFQRATRTYGSLNEPMADFIFTPKQ